MTDITEHKWSDNISINRATISHDKILIWCVADCLEGEDSIMIDKSDAIAIAKHFDIIRDSTKTVVLKPGESVLLIDENGNRPFPPEDSISITGTWHKEI